MERLQKLILPFLIGTIIIIIYLFYFKEKEELGKFSTFDPNNLASKEIRVKLVKEKGIDKSGHEAVYWVIDGDNKEMMVYGPTIDKLPEGIENAEILILLGHLTQSGFHSHAVRID